MKLTINVSGASLDDLTNIFYRLGDPGMEAVWESEKVDALQQYINQGCSLSDALDRFDADIHKKIEELEKQAEAKEAQQPVQPQITPVQPVQQPVQPQYTPVEPDPGMVYTPPTLDPTYAEMPRIQQAQPNNLHLDKAPSAPVVPNPQPAINTDDKLKQVATALVNKKGSKRLHDLLQPYGAESIMDLNNMLKDEFIKVLQTELAA